MKGPFCILLARPTLNTCILNGTVIATCCISESRTCSNESKVEICCDVLLNSYFNIAINDTARTFRTKLNVVILILTFLLLLHMDIVTYLPCVPHVYLKKQKLGRKEFGGGDILYFILNL
jgi:hypothetical protein